MTTPDPSCSKHPYTSRREAAQARRALRSGDRIRIYRCPDCHAWHFTSRIGTGDPRRSHKASRR